MAMIKCAKCGKEISDKASKCIHCGTTDFLETNSKEIEPKKDNKEIERLQKELENVKIKNLKKEIELEKKKEPKEKVNPLITIVNVIRYLVSIFLTIGGVATLVGGKIFLGVGYLVMAIPFYPFIYNIIWKDKQVSNNIKILIQFVAPIIGFIVGGILMSIGVK